MSWRLGTPQKTTEMTARMTGLDLKTLGKLILLAGERCEQFTHDVVRDIEVKDVQADEIWSYVGMKEKTRKRLDRSEDYGDSWTWIAVERHTKMVVAYHVGQRDGRDCQTFLDRMKRAIGDGRFQMTTDGLGAYRHSIPFTFLSKVDFGMLVKNYQGNPKEIRYSPASIISIEKNRIFGNPDMDKVCTSHIERLNLTLRMQMRRFTRLTNGFSKTIEHHTAMQQLFFAWYNFCRPHQTLKGSTPAMACGLTRHHGRWN
jgi:IS1 family transposase